MNTQGDVYKRASQACTLEQNRKNPPPILESASLAIFSGPKVRAEQVVNEILGTDILTCIAPVGIAQHKSTTKPSPVFQIIHQNEVYHNPCRSHLLFCGSSSPSFVQPTKAASIPNASRGRTCPWFGNSQAYREADGQTWYLYVLHYDCDKMPDR
jgi:hypothetical protein